MRQRDAQDAVEAINKQERTEERMREMAKRKTKEARDRVAKEVENDTEN